MSFIHARDTCPHCHATTTCDCADCSKTVDPNDTSKRIPGICKVCKGTGRDPYKEK